MGLSAEDSKARAIALGEFVQSLDGSHIQVVESISWRLGAGFERHSTIQNRFEFVVQSTMWTMSGGHYVLYGPGDTMLMLGTTKLAEFTVEDGVGTALEIFGSEAERMTVIRTSLRTAP